MAFLCVSQQGTRVQTPNGVSAKCAIRKKSDVLPTYLFSFLEIFWRFSGLKLENILMVFLGSSCKETAKNTTKKNEGKRRQEKRFSQKVFDMDFPKKVFNGVLYLCFPTYTSPNTKTPRI
jgi:hypothetical protein